VRKRPQSRLQPLLSLSTVPVIHRLKGEHQGEEKIYRSVYERDARIMREALHPTGWVVILPLSGM